MIFLDAFTQEKGVFQLSKLNDKFESSYLKLREKENRVLSDAEVGLLPNLASNLPHSKEWRLRQDSKNRVTNYLSQKKFQSALDIGCGNGWFTNILANCVDNVVGLDVNMLELEQASRVFSKPNLHFCYADLFDAELPKSGFDLITLNASVQYFSHLTRLVDRLLELLSDSGEIHFIDSPFYSNNEVPKAEDRSKEYYQAMDAPEMAKFYHHHTWGALKTYPYVLLFNPTTLSNKLKKKMGVPLSPFPWIVIRK